MGILKELFNERIDLDDDGSHLDGLLTAAVESIFAPAVTIEQVLRERGFSGTITDAAGHKRTYVDGKQVASRKDSDGGDPSGGEAVLNDGEKISLNDIENSDEVKANPAILEKVKTAAATGFKKAVALLSDPKAALYTIAYHTPQILGLWTDVFEGPDDMKKIGYNPSFTGVSGEHHTTLDPVKENLGIPAHMACGLLIKVGAAAIVAAKRKLGLIEAAGAMDFEAAGKFFNLFLTTIADELGLSAPPSAEEIAGHLKGLLGDVKEQTQSLAESVAVAVREAVAGIVIPAPIVNVTTPPRTVVKHSTIKHDKDGRITDVTSRETEE